MEYGVGQVLYCLNEKSFKIIPVQIVEEVVRTTINGKNKTYMVKFPDAKGSIVDIADIKSKMFPTKQMIRDYMIENTSKTIEKMLETADALKNEVFKFKHEDESVSDPTSLQHVSVNEKAENENIMQPMVNDDIIKIDLGNGIKANLNKSELDKVNK